VKTYSRDRPHEGPIPVLTSTVLLVTDPTTATADRSGDTVTYRSEGPAFGRIGDYVISG